MNTLKSIFSWIGRFLEKTRTVMLNLGTALILIFIAIIIIGGLLFFGPEIKDPSGRVLLIDPQGTVVDQGFYYTSWDGKTDHRKNVSSGIYLINYKTEKYFDQLKILYVK